MPPAYARFLNSEMNEAVMFGFAHCIIFQLYGHFIPYLPYLAIFKKRKKKRKKSIE